MEEEFKEKFSILALQNLHRIALVFTDVCFHLPFRWTVMWIHLSQQYFCLGLCFFSPHAVVLIAEAVQRGRYLAGSVCQWPVCTSIASALFTIVSSGGQGVALTTISIVELEYYRGKLCVCLVKEKSVLQKISFINRYFVTYCSNALYWII